ncbi:putative nucleic acid-binding protein [Pedobacter sp. W3I1]|uniref:type II toxin-antitoxin system VapC family toxin n=1 Tax=Pedobacter sp. W3I1 TaxID=3042291 RepID=UPI002789DA1B|nr:PIN domain-containing protein [Pedobacter sp. W3I1]MDQ0636689.1 putative nucleic acid-binding protein [Pedobacter sp. W3I1]|eukprot:TRINITY_DN56272_c0_g1_i1.p1 TRINITY_DN56272_c0_g1~~TRINITY_DN56272_c0_g1_i1.p1  ORF type:complete len:138 (-),score=22.24 TRINITY_DN56272_c0_g1_i1:195-608(-)
MKKIFVDTNIIVDLIADRKPFSKFAIEIFERAERNEVQLFTSSHSIATTHYLLKKHLEEKKLRDVIYNVLYYIQIIAIDQDIIKKGLKSKHKDFEDALQMLCAYNIEKLDYIVTRNIKDFKDSEIPVFPPDELLTKI